MSQINVPADYLTISAAITASNPGDTIVVAAGTYNEQLFINKALIILGAQANVDARTRSAVPESIINFSPSSGNGVVNFLVQNININGFTIQGSNILGSSGAFAGDTNTFPPNTNTINVSNLQFLNNIVTGNANGMLIASAEPFPSSYLVKFCYFQNNNGYGTYFSNSSQMTNVIITENLYEGLGNNPSIFLNNINTGIITSNVLSESNSIYVSNSLTVTINSNISYLSTSDGITIGDNCNNVNITQNLITNALNNGITIGSNNTLFSIANNCISLNVNTGVLLAGTNNSTFYINNNNINGNGNGVIFTQYNTPPLDLTNNYWGSPSGPNINGGGPGTGDTISTNGIPIYYTPFRITGIDCITPLILSKVTTSINVSPGTPISFTVTLIVPIQSATYALYDLPPVTLFRSIPFTLNSFSDLLPTLPSGGTWMITSQVPANFFILNGNNLEINGSLPISLTTGVYSVTVEINTNALDAGEIVPNTVNAQIEIGEMVKDLQNSAVASVAICLHSSSKILLKNGEEIEICKLKSDDEISTPEGISKVIEVVPCWAGYENKIYSTCVIFEPNSLGWRIPKYRTAIDAGHPICTPEEYIEGKNFKCSREYVNGKDIYLVKWDEVEALLPGENKRYDIILSEDSCKSYFANNLIVQSRQDRKNPGYGYE